MVIRAGLLQSRLSVVAEQLADLPNGGQGVIEVAVLTNEPANIRPISAQESVAYGAHYATATHRALLRYPRDEEGLLIEVKPHMRATAVSGYTGRAQAFAIVGVFDVEARGRELELLLSERVT
jgi:head-tail adaptor